VFLTTAYFGTLLSVGPDVAHPPVSGPGWLVTYMRLVDWGARLALVPHMRGLSAVLRLSLAGSAPEPELPVWMEVAACNASPWLCLWGSSQLRQVPPGSNAFHAVPWGFRLTLDVEKYCKALPQLEGGVFCDEGKHQVRSLNCHV